MSTPTLLVKKTSLSTIEWHRLPTPPLGEGQLRLRVESFAFTANNVTYAAFGEAMSYWQFYPVPIEGFGVIPVWGFGRVTESRCEGVAVGELFYGYYPFATDVVLTPIKLGPAGFVEGAAHRQGLAAVYNQYNRCEADGFFSEDTKDIQALLRPLFITSWLINDFFADNADFGATHLLLSSASSKTAYGAAFAITQRGLRRPRVVGLTSAKNRSFCESLGCYDQLLTYEELDQLPAALSCAYVDFAGSTGLRKSIHERFGNLKYSCSIGGTHVSDLGSGKGLPGPKPTLFFAPAQIKKRVGDWGGAEFTTRILAAWKAFCAEVTKPAQPWLLVQHHEGQKAAGLAYQLVLDGQADPRVGHIIVL